MNDDTVVDDAEENPVGNRLYTALTDPDAVSDDDAAYVGRGLAKIEQRMPDGQMETYTLETDEDVDDFLWVTRGGDAPTVETYGRDVAEDYGGADVVIWNTAFHAGITQLFEDAPFYESVREGYEAEQPDPIN